MKKYRIIYNMYPENDIEIIATTKNEEEAIVFAKAYRKDSFRIFEVKEGR